MEIVRTTVYAKAIKRIRKLGASADDIMAMENAIAAAPEVGDVIPGTRGLRKMRFGYAKTGKRGGGRTIYFVITEDETVYLLTAYTKADREDLTETEKKLFVKFIQEEIENG